MTHLAFVATGVAVAAVCINNGFLTVAVFIARRGHKPEATGEARQRPPALAVIRPVHGRDAMSAVSNARLVAQRYAGSLEVIFVASRRADPGLVLAREAYGGDPRVTCLVAQTSVHATDKASNMMAGWHATRAPFVAFCDADVLLPPEVLADCMALFDDVRVGAVFAPALHTPSTVLQRLASMVTSGDKLVTVRTMERLGLLSVMEGGLMIVRRSAVERAGSIDLLNDTVADDLRLATAIVAAGYRLRAGPPIVHPQEKCGARAFARQYHRWMACQRLESPKLLVAQLALHGILQPLLACALAPESAVPWIVLGVSAVWRIALTRVIERTLLARAGPGLGAWVLARPIADVLHVLMCLSAFAVSTVTWGDRTYRFERRYVLVRPLVQLARDPRRAR